MWPSGYRKQIWTLSQKESEPGPTEIRMTFIQSSWPSWSTAFSTLRWTCLPSTCSRRWAGQYGQVRTTRAKKHKRRPKWTVRSQLSFTTTRWWTSTSSSGTLRTTFHVPLPPSWTLSARATLKTPLSKARSRLMKAIMMQSFCRTNLNQASTHEEILAVVPVVYDFPVFAFLPVSCTMYSKLKISLTLRVSG